MNKSRIREAIIGIALCASFLLGHFLSPLWHLINLVIGLLMIQGAFTCFCPVRFLLDRIIKDEPSSTIT